VVKIEPPLNEVHDALDWSNKNVVTRMCTCRHADYLPDARDSQLEIFSFVAVATVVDIPALNLSITVIDIFPRGI